MARKARTNPGKDAEGGSGAGGKKPKRVRRKCSAPGCANRVVQGGVCVTHGAKRKLCSLPGCDKAVKLAGFCSTHGPARRKCDYEGGCSRVAVQAGKCLSHGARRRVCNYPLSVNGKGGKEEKCTKNAIMGGMCKKHYDRVQDANGMLEMSLCVPINAASSASFSANNGGSSSGEEEEEFSSLGSSPSWTSASTSAVAVSASAMAMAPNPLSTNTTTHRGTRSPKQKKMKPSKGHERGLSIFDEMPTVDAIINSGSGVENQTPQPQHKSQGGPKRQPRKQVVCPPVPQAPPPPVVLSADVVTKTPRPQVSFADCTSLPNKDPGVLSDSPEPCTGNASCSCNACRSPTLAIFDQMIQASQKLERGDFDPTKYAALSPPKLSPRKPVSSHSSARASGATTATPKNVSFLPEEPTSTGSVVRKVSSNNIVGESWQNQVAAQETVNRGGIPQYAPRGYPQAPRNQVQEVGPASNALAEMALDENGVKRTVSHDVDDGRNHPSSHYYPQYPHPPHVPLPPPPHYSHGPPPPPGYTHHHYGGSGNYHQSTPHAFHPPQTPALYGNSTPMAVVSTHSTTHEHHHEHQLLPRPRENMSHLFIPKEV